MMIALNTLFGPKVMIFQYRIVLHKSLLIALYNDMCLSAMLNPRILAFKRPRVKEIQVIHEIKLYSICVKVFNPPII